MEKISKHHRNGYYFLLVNRKPILLVLVLLAMLLGMVGFAVSDQTVGILDVINNTIGLFMLSYPPDDNNLLDFAKLFANVAVFFGVIILFFSDSVNGWIIKSIQKKDYDLLIGLGEQNQALLTDQEDIGSTLIIEANKANHWVDIFRREGAGVIISTAENALCGLNYDQLRHCIISTGNDRRNISLAIQLLKILKNDVKGIIYIRVDNRDLSILFKQEVVSAVKAKGVDIIPYSHDEIISKCLFAEHSILGFHTEIIENNHDYSIILIGASNLLVEIIYHLAVLAHLPEQNHLHIICVDKASRAFCNKVEKHFSGIREIPHLSLESVELDVDTLAFFTDELWHSENLTNIIIATDDEEQNLDIATNLQDTTYIIETTRQEPFYTKILFAIYNYAGLGEQISDNKGVFANFHSFGDFSKISTRENILDEKLDILAKLINCDYQGKLKSDTVINHNTLHKEWMTTTSLSDKESCRAQALHIDVKLLAFGMKKEKSNKSLVELLAVNQANFDKKLVDKVNIDLMLVDYKSSYFPAIFDSKLDKVARSEHNRWNAFHYLHGWKYSKVKNKKAKCHDNLMPLEDFSSNAAKETYQYDMLAVLGIPKYLAHAGYIIY